MEIMQSKRKKEELWGHTWMCVCIFLTLFAGKKSENGTETANYILVSFFFLPNVKVKKGVELNISWEVRLRLKIWFSKHFPCEVLNRNTTFNVNSCLSLAAFACASEKKGGPRKSQLSRGEMCQWQAKVCGKTRAFKQLFSARLNTLRVVWP